MIDSTLVIVTIASTIPPTIASLAALITALRTKNIALDNTRQLVDHNKSVTRQIDDVKKTVNGQMDKLVETTERAAIAETLISVRPEKPEVSYANPEEQR